MDFWILYLTTFISSQQTFNLGSVLNDIFRVYLIKRKYDKYIGVAHIIHTRIVQIEQVGGGFVGGSHHSALTKGVVPSQNTHQKHLLVSASVCVAIRKLGTLCKVASFAVLGSCGLAAESEVEALPTDGIYVLVWCSMKEFLFIYITRFLLHAHFLSLAENISFEIFTFHNTCIRF